MIACGFGTIIEISAVHDKATAQVMAKEYAKRFGPNPITDEENLVHMKVVNKETKVHERKIMHALKKLSIPDDLKDNLIKDAKHVVEEWRGANL